MLLGGKFQNDTSPVEWCKDASFRNFKGAFFFTPSSESQIPNLLCGCHNML